MRSDAEIRQRIEDEIARYAEIRWYASVSGLRHHIGRRVGRVLLTPNETERCLEHYRGCWPPGETPYSQVIEVMNGLEPICYGDHWKQRWYLLRDLVPVTRKYRAIMRTRRFCSICHERVDAIERRHQNREENPTETREFWEVISSRHFPDCLRSVRSSRRFTDYLHWYRQERSPEVCCGARCEATRFSRWYGRREWEDKQMLKEEHRYQKEQQWIREGKQSLKKVRQYLSQRA